MDLLKELHIVVFFFLFNMPQPFTDFFYFINIVLLFFTNRFDVFFFVLVYFLLQLRVVFLVILFDVGVFLIDSLIQVLQFFLIEVVFVLRSNKSVLNNRVKIINSNINHKNLTLYCTKRSAALIY